jgi:hypothetical protein
MANAQTPPEIVDGKVVRSQAAMAIAEADAPGAAWVPHEDIEKDMRLQRAAIEARLTPPLGGRVALPARGNS